MVSSPSGSTNSSSKLGSRFLVHGAVLAASGEPVVGILERGAHGEVVLRVGEENGIGGLDLVEGHLDGQRDALFLDVLVEEWELGDVDDLDVEVRVVGFDGGAQQAGVGGGGFEGAGDGGDLELSLHWLGWRGYFYYG